MKRWIVASIFPLLTVVALTASVLKALIKFFLLLPLEWLHWQTMETIRRLVWWAVKYRYDHCNCAECLKERNER